MTSPPPDEDDDRTVIRPAGARRAAMGHTLPVGTRLEGDLEITGLIGEGGFGIVYLAHDHSLDRRVAVKEYMPGSLASRAAGGWQVSVKSERHRDTFEAGRKSFVNEAKLLARFDHPALVKVFRFWEANQTAYMAMPYYEGPTLKSALAELGAPPDEAQLRAWLRPLLDALAVMHKEQCFHRDIAPDNILLTGRGPLLLDFGAARRVIGDMTHALTVVLKPGYAPIEQYGQAAAMTQGPWTDLYALASVVHYAIVGQAPNSSVERIMGDTLEPLAQRAAGRYSDTFLQAMDAALAVRPKDRPQDVRQFRELLNAGLAADSADLFHSSGFQSSGFHSSGFSPSAFDAKAHEPTVPRSVPLTVPTTAPHAQTVAEPETWMDLRTQAPPVAVPPPVPAAARSRRTLLLLAGLAVLAAGAGVGVLLRQRKEPASDVVTAPPPEPAASAAAAAPAPVEAAAPAPPPAVEPAPVPVPAPPPVAVEAPPPAPAPVPEAPAPPAVAEAPAAAPAVVRRPARPVAPTPPVAKVKPARCSDILLKASLEPLTPEEAAYLKRECR